jgi:hypothetical protein
MTTAGCGRGGYTSLQNEDHAQFLNLLGDESGAIFDTAG